MSDVRRLDDEFFAELDEIDRWLNGLGVKQHNRFRIYKDNIAWLRQHDAEEERARVYKQLANDGRLSEILSTMVDSIDIVETIPTLRDFDVDIPIDLLKAAFSGPADVLREDHRSNNARNAMFELNMAAIIARQGLRPVLSTSNPDISFEFCERNVKVECKRVLTDNKVFARIGEGIQQLKKSVRDGKSEVGIVAISVSRLLNRGDAVIVTPDPHELLANQLNVSLKPVEQRLGRMAKPWAAGLIFHLSSPMYVPEVGYTRGKHGTVFPMDLNQQPFLLNLARSLAV